MHVVGKDKNNEGKFSFEVYCGSDLVEFGGNYPDFKSAEAAAQISERYLAIKNYKVDGEVTRNDFVPLDDILSELEL